MELAKEKQDIPQGGVVEKNDEVVTLKKSDLDDLMSRLKRVEFAADKSHLAQFDEQNQKAPSKTVKLRMIKEKIVLSWDNMVTNLVEKTPAGNWYEDQKVKLNFEDGESEEMLFMDFNRRFRLLKAEVLSKTVENQGTEDEKTILKVRTAEGREYSVDKRFVN